MSDDCMINTMMGEKAYRIKHVAKKLGLSVETIRRYVRSGKLEAYHFSKEYFITESQLQRFIEKGCK